MPLKRKPERNERLSKKPNRQSPLDRLQKLICMAGSWSNEKDMVLLRWHKNKWQLWRGEDPIE